MGRIFYYPTAYWVDLPEFSIENPGKSRLSRPRFAEALQRRAILVQTLGSVALKGQ
jgi:hypothetical protein